MNEMIRTHLKLGAIAALLVGLGAPTAVLAQISIPTNPATPYVQDFDGLGTLAAATLPTDWRAATFASSGVIVGTWAGAGTATTQRAGTANFTAGGIYNYGAGAADTATDRALGFLGTGTIQSASAFAHLRNTSGSPLESVTVSFDVEKYRNGTNAQGFRFQMYHSLDGTTWTSSGAPFLVSFAGGDANTNAFDPAPGATSSVTAQTLTVGVPNNGDLYLAFNYAVNSGTTYTNAQGIGIDNFSVYGTTGAAIDYTAAPTVLDFGAIDASDNEDLTVTVTAAENVSITGSSFTGDAGFSLLTSLPLNILAGNDGDLVFRYSPATNDGASASGTFTLQTNGSPATFDVTVDGASLREVPLAQAKAEYEAQVAPWTSTTIYKVEGIVSSNTTGANNSNTVTIQDLTDGSAATRGMSIVDFSAVGLDSRAMPAIGDTVTAFGPITNFRGVVQVVPDRPYDIDSSSPAMITPRTVLASDLSDATEGVLLRLNGVTVAADDTITRNQNRTLRDNTSADFTFRLDNNPNFDAPVPYFSFVTTNSYTVTGVGGQFAATTNEPVGSTGYQVLGRDTNSVQDETSVSDWLFY